LQFKDDDTAYLTVGQEEDEEMRKIDRKTLGQLWIECTISGEQNHASILAGREVREIGN